jgi:hypothetical protein
MKSKSIEVKVFEDEGTLDIKHKSSKSAKSKMDLLVELEYKMERLKKSPFKKNCVFHKDRFEHVRY